MKIGTISLNINTHDLNYGAMLHSWAFQKFLMKYKGVETEIIDYTTPNLYGKNLKYPMWGYLKEGRIKSFVVACIRLVSHGKRFEKFENFKKECLDISEVKYSQEKLAQEQLDYEVVFCESDVIWSPGFFGGDFDPAFFLALPSMTSAKRIAYAASMANAGFSVEQEQHFRVLLQSLDAVSCRETYAAAYTQKFCEKKVECVVDPVLLLKAEEYKTVTAPRMIAEPYLLLYFPLGYDTYIIKAAKKYAAKKHLKLVEISRFPWDKLSHKTILDAGIEEFLSLIQNAEVVFSNSFHAVCFSVIFKRDFYVFNRKTGQKMKDICCRLGLENRFVDGSFSEQEPIDYESVYQRLDELVVSSVEFIEKNLEL